MVPQSLPSVRCKANFKPVKSLLRQATPGQIAPRISARAGVQLQFKKLQSLLHHIGQLRPSVSLLLSFRVSFRHRHAGLPGQNLDRFHKRNILSFFYKAQRITFSVTAKTVVIALTVIDVKARRFLLVKRAWCPHITLALIGFSAVPHDFAGHDL